MKIFAIEILAIEIVFFLIVFLLYIVGCGIINALFKETLKLSFKINQKFPKNFENKVSPIYRIDLITNDKCIITKKELKLFLNKKISLYISLICPIPINYYSYQYIYVHSVSDVDINKPYLPFQNYIKKTYEEFVEICEKDILKNNKIKDKQKILLEEKNSFNEEINKVYNENYFE